MIFFITRCKFALQVIPALMLALISLAGCADSAGRTPDAPDGAQDYWYDGSQRKTVWPAADEIVLFTGRALTAADAAALARDLSPGATVARHTGSTLDLQLNAAPDPGALSRKIDTLKQAGRIRSAGLVYYTSPSKQPRTRLILGHAIVVRFAGTVTPGQITHLEKTFHLKRKSSLKFAPNTFVYTVSDLAAVLPTANRLYESGQTVYAYPDWIKTRVKKSTKQP